MVLDSKSIQATVAATAAAAAFGSPLAAAATALTGATVELGKIALTVAKRKHDFQKLKRDHELAYIIEAQEHLE